MQHFTSHAKHAATLLAAAATLALAAAANAETLKIDAVMTPKEQIRLDFKDGSNHFVLMVRREGKAEGQGVLAGAAMTEHGYHDIVPGIGGDPRGYLVATRPDGDMAYISWTVRAVFIPGADGKPVLLDNGVWEIVSGTGKLKNLKGAGTLHIKAISPTDPARRFTLEGETALK